MIKILRIGIVSLMGVALLGCPIVLAKGPGGNGNHGGETEHSEGLSHREGGGGFSHGEKKGWKGENTPPGWSKGKKKGWNGSKIPRGLAKEKGKRVE